MIAFQSEIIKRFMSEENYKLFVEDYKNARKVFRRDRRFTFKDMQIYKDYQTGLTMAELVEKYHISYPRARTIVVQYAQNKDE